MFSDERKLSLYSPELKNRLAKIDSYEVAKPYFEEVKHQDRINQALYLDMQLLLSGNNLVKPDRMGMAVSLEARTPFLDYRMMEFGFRMPGELKLKHGETKYLYKKAVAPLIGEDLAYRKKQMFTVPVGDWFRTTKKQYCFEEIQFLINSSSLFLNGSVQQLFDSHISGQENNTRELRSLIAISHWLKI